MTTVIPFLPSNLVAPKFSVVLDGDPYNVVITWNISAQRYYVNVYGLDGSWLITIPLIQSPPARNIETIKFDPFQQAMIVKFVDPSLWPIPLSKEGVSTDPGTIVDYTLENFDPPFWNTKWRSLHIDPITFSFPMPSDPGEIKIVGTVSRYLNMVGSIFRRSTLIYRNGAFEVTP